MNVGSVPSYSNTFQLPQRRMDGALHEEDEAKPAEGQRDAGAQESSDPAEKAQQARVEANDRELKARDREVRAHELAHLSAGGPYVSHATFTYERGSDGVMYAVGGEVRIDTSPVHGDPQATLSKAETVHRAALAPAEPSAQDRRVASRAAAMAMEAKMDMGRGVQEGGSSPVDRYTTSEADESTTGLDLYA